MFSTLFTKVYNFCKAFSYRENLSTMVSIYENNAPGADSSFL